MCVCSFGVRIRIGFIFLVDFECVFIVCMFERFRFLSFSSRVFFLLFSVLLVACFLRFAFIRVVGSDGVWERVCKQSEKKEKRRNTIEKHLFSRWADAPSEPKQRKKNLLKIVHTSMIASYSFYFYFRLIHASTKKGEFALILEMFSTSTSSSAPYSLYYFFFLYLIGCVRMCVLTSFHRRHSPSLCRWSNITTNLLSYLPHSSRVIANATTAYDLHTRITEFGPHLVRWCTFTYALRTYTHAHPLHCVWHENITVEWKKIFGFGLFFVHVIRRPPFVRSLFFPLPFGIMCVIYFAFLQGLSRACLEFDPLVHEYIRTIQYCRFTLLSLSLSRFSGIAK